ncbi:hypothetical protein LOCC1_G005088 [Lachnellula occidentalis]|uniref:Protein TMA23 n=1 Tax=Lachnellula occidentalis TaxID=215460 RepID=A0A8H8U8Y0_9HELO|nr:hypothetical protein LOCC1_G005088 [Lachnellula occidentalis]
MYFRSHNGKRGSWRGTGHSLHPTNDKTGLSRPLLVSRKDNVLGIGKKQHNTSDMWWLNAFDSSLKGLDTSKQGTVVQTVTSGGLDMVVKGGGKFVGNKGLYASFVRGECLTGTLGEEKTPESSGTSTPDVQVGDKEREKKRRKKDGLETKEERRERKAAKRAARAKELTPAPVEVEEIKEDIVEGVETKEERRERRRLKKLAKEAARKPVEVSSEKAKKKKRRKTD